MSYIDSVRGLLGESVMGTNNTTFVFKSPSELKINPYNLSIYGSEPLDWDLVYSIEKNGLLNEKS